MDQPTALAPPPPRKPTLRDWIRMAPMTYVFCVIDVLVFFYVERHGGTTTSANLIRYGAEERGHIWSGEFWRLATPMFLHIGIIHLAVNTWAIPTWSRSVEAKIGSPLLTIVYLASGIGGTALSVLAQDAPGSAGASGAGFGLIGVTLVLRYAELGSFAAFRADRAVQYTIFVLGLWTMIGMTALRFNTFAHGGGLIVGIAFGAALLLAPRIGRNAAFAGFAVFVFALAAAAAHQWPGQQARWEAPAFEPTDPQ